MLFILSPYLKFYITRGRYQYFFILQPTKFYKIVLPLHEYFLFMSQKLCLLKYSWAHLQFPAKAYVDVFRYTDFAKPFKLCFKRKGGWIFTRPQWPCALIYKFGYSHPLRLCLGGLRTKIYKKYLLYHILLLSGAPFRCLQNFGALIRFTRPINMYSKRGVKFGRQQFLKRKGKDSQYTKLKSKIF